MKWFIMGAAIIAGLALWHYLPVGRRGGRNVVLKELAHANTRLLLAIGKLEAALAECVKLPPRQRLARMLEIEVRFKNIYHPGDPIRRAIVATGTAAAATQMARILAMPRMGQASVIWGIRDAVATGDMDEGFQLAAYDLLLKGLNRETTFGVASANIPELMLVLDPARSEVLFDEICVRETDHYLFPMIFGLMEKRGTSLDPEVRESLLATEVTAETPSDEVTRQILAAQALAATDRGQAEELLERILEARASHPFDAENALLRVRDLPHPRYLLDDLKERIGMEHLGEEERTVWLADQCAYFLEMDKLWDSHWSEDGDLLVEMHEALVKVGAPKAAAILHACIALYGPDGPSP